MKQVNYINILLYGITLTFYIMFFTIFIAMMLQVVLGIYQVLLALILTYKFYAKFKNFLLKYWISATISLTAIYFLNQIFKTNNDFIQISVMLIIPMSIATYFTITLNKIAKTYEKK
ncbi:hypothetical protein [Flavobacterium okayamense]|uniref:Uncharacterized protein n=1 Tax=Flavobacterium okayamense TaxID=2830782 RepID=A0ABM7SBW3_9FLAO|nr:hypothetical protein [Flavobacterium okayamense]BCY28266.1 hypothetical protein KK2020170_11340 [Flavobacterium okayamense]